MICRMRQGNGAEDADGDHDGDDEKAPSSTLSILRLIRSLDSIKVSFVKMSRRARFVRDAVDVEDVVVGVLKSDAFQNVPVRECEGRGREGPRTSMVFALG